MRRRSVVGAPGPTIAVLVLWTKESSAATIKVPPPHAPPPPPLPPSIDGRLGGGPDCTPPTGGGDRERRLSARCFHCPWWVTAWGLAEAPTALRRARGGVGHHRRAFRVAWERLHGAGAARRPQFKGETCLLLRTCRRRPGFLLMRSACGGLGPSRGRQAASRRRAAGRDRGVQNRAPPWGGAFAQSPRAFFWQFCR